MGSRGVDTQARHTSGAFGAQRCRPLRRSRARLGFRRLRHGVSPGQGRSKGGRPRARQGIPPGVLRADSGADAHELVGPEQGPLRAVPVVVVQGHRGALSSGLGGGSLIRANVLLRKDPSWFVEDRPDGSTRPWPVGYDELVPHYEAAEQMIGIQRYPVRGRRRRAPCTKRQRRRAIRRSTRHLRWLSQILGSSPLSVSRSSRSTRSERSQALHVPARGRVRRGLQLGREELAGLHLDSGLYPHSARAPERHRGRPTPSAVELSHVVLKLSQTASRSLSVMLAPRFRTCGLHRGTAPQCYEGVGSSSRSRAPSRGTPWVR